MSRSLVAVAVASIALFFSVESRADCNDDGGCAPNQYCALADGGDAIDASGGACALEPCVVSSDCTGASDKVCDTSVEPHRCVECVSSGDCPIALTCDVATHTCVLPSGGDAGPFDASTPDASPPADASLPPVADASPPRSARDASDAAGDGAIDAGDAGPADFGSLSGGACDCDLATAPASPLLALALSSAIAALFFARRRRARH